MKLTELRACSVQHLQAELGSLLREQFNLKIQFRAGKLKQTHRLKKVKKKIVKVKTIMNEKIKDIT